MDAHYVDYNYFALDPEFGEDDNKQKLSEIVSKIEYNKKQIENKNTEIEYNKKKILTLLQNSPADYKYIDNMLDKIGVIKVKINELKDQIYVLQSEIKMLQNKARCTCDYFLSYLHTKYNKKIPQEIIKNILKNFNSIFNGKCYEPNKDKFKWCFKNKGYKIINSKPIDLLEVIKEDGNKRRNSKRRNSKRRSSKRRSKS